MAVTFLTAFGSTYLSRTIKIWTEQATQLLWQGGLFTSSVEETGESGAQHCDFRYLLAFSALSYYN